MATKINIAQLDIDIDGLKSSMVEAKRELDRLVESNREMRKAGDSANETYIEQDAAIKRLRAEYNSQARVLNQAIVAIEGADKAYNAQIKTVAQAEAANKTLRQAVKHLDTTTLEGIQTAELYNKRIEENTAFMKDNVDEQIQGYMSVGEYSKGIQDAARELNPFNMLLKGMTGGFKEAGGVLPFVTQSLKGVVGGIRAATVSSLAFIATPIGAVIGAIGLALGLVINYLKNTESGMDKVMSVLTPLNEIFKQFLAILEDVGKFLSGAIIKYVKSAIKYFGAWGKIMMGIANRDLSMIKEGLGDIRDVGEDVANSLVKGFEDVSKRVKGLGDEFSDAAKRGAELHDLRLDLRDLQLEILAGEGAFEDALLKQKLIYEDRSRTEEERMAASKEILKLQEDRNNLLLEELKTQLAILDAVQDAGENGEEDMKKRLEILNKISEVERGIGEEQRRQLSRNNNIRERGERERERAAKEYDANRKKALEERKRIEEAIANLKKSESELTDAQERARQFLLEQGYDAQKKIAEDETKSWEERRKAFEEWDNFYKTKVKDEEEANKLVIESNEAEIKAAKDKYESSRLSAEQAEENHKAILLYRDRELAKVEEIEKELAGIFEYEFSIDEIQKTFDSIVRNKEKLGEDFGTEEWIDYGTDELISELEATLKNRKESAEYEEELLEKLKVRKANAKEAAEEALKASEKTAELSLEELEHLENLNKLQADLTDKSIDFSKAVSEQKEEALELSKRLSEGELEDIKALREAKLQMFLETTKLQMESEKERLDYEREIRKLNLEDELDEEKAFLLSKLELLDVTEEEKTETLLRHEELRRELLSDLEEQWMEEDKQRIYEYESYRRGVARETTDLIKENFKEKTAMGKALMVAQKAFALQEWVIQKKKAIAEQSLNKATATGELAKGQAKTAASAPFPLNIPLILGFVAQAAGILAMFKPPKVKDPKFARGTILGGSRHFEGGIKTPFGEVEGGEMLLTRGVTFDPILRSMASQLNMMGGGDRLDTGSSVGSIRSPKGFIDYDTLAAKVAQANRHLPSPLVRVSDIDRVQDSVKVIDDLTTF